MEYAIFSQDGNLLDCFADEAAAKAALQAIVFDEPEAETEMAIVVLDGAGMPTGEAIVPLPVDVAPMSLGEITGHATFKDVTRSAAAGVAEVTAQPVFHLEPHTLHWKGTSTVEKTPPFSRA